MSTTMASSRLERVEAATAALAETVRGGGSGRRWGAEGPTIPKRFRGEPDVCGARGHKCIFPESFVNAFVRWLLAQDLSGFSGAPSEFGRLQ